MERPAAELIYELVEATYTVVEQTETNIKLVLKDLDISRPLADVLWALDPAKASKSMGELASAVGCDPSTATFTVDRLQEKGYLTRTPDTRDRRRTTVALTPRGLEARRLLVRAVVDGSPVASLPEKDMATLISILRKAIGPAKPTYEAATSGTISKLGSLP